MKGSLFLLLIFVTATLGQPAQGVECALCGLAVNAIQGFAAENKTETEIMATMTAYCDGLADQEVQAVCDEFITFVPQIIAFLESKESVGSICLQLEYCATYHGQVPDPHPVGHFVINLDLAPKDRWTALYSIPEYKSAANYVLEAILAVAPKELVSLMDSFGEDLESFFPQPFSDEIRGGADALGVDPGLLAVMNLFYELSDDCTSIVGEQPDGSIIHSRNLDFGAGIYFTDALRNLTVQLDFQSQGKTVYHGVTYVGYVGALTGMKPGVFSISVNTRFIPGGVLHIIDSLVEALTVKGAAVNSMLIRQTLLTATSFDDALQTFSNHPLISPVYFTIAGTKSGEGAVITRDRNNARDVWKLDASNGTWYVLETNYDHWEAPPWYDDRRTPANIAMKQMGRENLSLDNLLEVLSVKPVLNLMTTYTAQISAKDNTFNALGRYCNDPCPA